MQKTLRREPTIEDFQSIGLSRDIAHFGLWFHRNLRTLTHYYGYDEVSNMVYKHMYDEGGRRKKSLNDAEWKFLCEKDEALQRIYNR